MEWSFLTLAVQFGLENYVVSRLKDKDKPKKVLRPKRGRPLLDYAVVPSPIAPYDLVKSTFVQALLNLGASPNDEFEKQTSWERALQWQYDAFVEKNASVVRDAGCTSEDARVTAEDRVKTFQLLIKKGANVRASIVTSKGRKITARQAVDESFSAWLSEEARASLLSLFPTDVEPK